MKLTYLQTLQAMSRALELLDCNHFTEAEALRMAWLEQHERPEASIQLPLLKESPCANTAAST